MRIQCCHKKCQNRKKKNQFFFQNIFNKIAIFKKKYKFLENITYIFRFWKFFPSFWLLNYLFRSNNKAMNQLFPTSCWIHKKLWKSCQLYILRPPYSQIMTPHQKNFLPHGVKLFFGEKSPTHNNAAPKLNAWEQKIGGGGGLLKPPPPDRIGITVFVCINLTLLLRKSCMLRYYCNTCQCFEIVAHHNVDKWTQSLRWWIWAQKNNL